MYTQSGKYTFPSSAVNSKTPQWVVLSAEGFFSSNNIGYSMFICAARFKQESENECNRWNLSDKYKLTQAI